MEIIKSAADLVVGDVVFVAKYIEPRGRDAFWWRAYWVVTRTINARLADLMLLKMNPDPDKDHRMFDFQDDPNKQVIQYLHPDDYPQGVQAIRAKHVMQGRIKLAG